MISYNINMANNLLNDIGHYIAYSGGTICIFIIIWGIFVRKRISYNEMKLLWEKREYKLIEDVLLRWANLISTFFALIGTIVVVNSIYIDLSPYTFPPSWESKYIKAPIADVLLLGTLIFFILQANFKYCRWVIINPFYAIGLTLIGLGGSIIRLLA